LYSIGMSYSASLISSSWTTACRLSVCYSFRKGKGWLSRLKVLISWDLLEPKILEKYWTKASTIELCPKGLLSHPGCIVWLLNSFCFSNSYDKTPNFYLLGQTIYLCIFFFGMLASKWWAWWSWLINFCSCKDRLESWGLRDKFICTCIRLCLIFVDSLNPSP